MITNLGAALGWKYNHESGMTTRGDKLVNWPDTLGPRPTLSQLQAVVNAYNALSTDHPTKDPRMARLKRFDGLDPSNVALRAFIRDELLS